MRSRLYRPLAALAVAASLLVVPHATAAAPAPRAGLEGVAAFELRTLEDSFGIAEHLGLAGHAVAMGDAVRIARPRR